MQPPADAYVRVFAACAGTVVFVPGSRRLLFTLLTPLTQAGVSLVSALLLSRAAAGSASGWGDLLGAVVGLVLGAGLGLGVSLALVLRFSGRGWILALGALPAGVLSAPVVLAVFSALGFSFPLAAAGYLLAGTALAWWCTRLPPRRA